MGDALARDIAQQRVDERRAARAGSQDVNTHRQRLDDREFLPTRETLRWLSVVQLGQHHGTGRFHPDVINGWRLTPPDLTKYGLPDDHGIESRVSDDGQQWWAWRATVSGWVLGFALRADGGAFLEYMYAGSIAPDSAPTEETSPWGRPWDTPPDWTGLEDDN